MKQSDSQQSKFESDSSLYIGSKSRPFSFIRTNALSRYTYSQGTILSQKNLQSLRSALTYRFAQSFLNPLYEKLYLPCIPAYDLTVIQAVNEKEKQHDFIAFGPLIKTSVSGKVQEKLELHQQLLEGYQSGKRSGIVIFQNVPYRLKGCGNLNEGFPLLRGVTEDSETYEIRGCMFNHTVKRELFITDIVSKMLEPVGFACGNKSIGYWEYDDLAQANNKFGNYFGKQLQNECPEVDKYCGVFETLGDKRLGTHLLQGLKLLLHILLHMNRDEINLEEIKKLVTKPARIETYSWEKEKGTFHLSSTFTRMRDYDTFETINQDIKQQAKSNLIFDWEQENNNNINTLENIQPSTDIAFPFSFSYLPDTNKIIQIEALLAQLNIHPDYNIPFFSNLNSILSSENTLFQILLIFEKIGWEIGAIKRIFIDNDFNWGYYRDHHRLIYHCNAHLNNFLVLNPSFSEKNSFNILAPLDFDLAHLQFYSSIY